MNYLQKKKTTKELKDMIKVNDNISDFITDLQTQYEFTEVQFNDLDSVKQHLENTSVIFNSMLDGLKKK